MAQKRKKKQTKPREMKKVSPKTPAKNQLKPLVRTMLLTDLVFLAGIQILCDMGVIMESAGTGATMLGALVLIVALFIQFCVAE